MLSLIPLFIPLVFGLDDAIVIGLGGAIIGALSSYFSNRQNNKAAMNMVKYAREMSSGMTGSEIQQFQFNVAEAQKTRDWQKTEMLEGPSWQVKGYEDAGLNPALMYQNGLTFPAAGNMARADGVNAPVPQTFGLDLSSVMNMAIQAAKLPSEVQLAKANASKAEADARVQNANADLLEIDKKTRAEYNELRNQGQQLQNDLTKKEKDKVEQEISESKERVNLIKKQANTEEAKREALLAEAFLKEAQANEIVYLMPFRAALMQAQTEEAKSIAAFNFARASHEQQLLDMGIVEQEFRLAMADADEQEIQNEWNKWQISLKDGSYWAPEDGDSRFTAGRKAFMRRLSFMLYFVGENMPVVSGISGHLNLGTNSSSSSSSSNSSSSGSYSARGKKD